MKTRDEIIRDGIKIWDSHVKEFEKKYTTKNTLPRSTAWRPFRFCVQNVIVGLAVVRYFGADNLLEVDVCLMAKLPQFEDYASTRLMTIFLISEAFHVGSSLEIRFTSNVAEGVVPDEICDLALLYNIELKYIDRGVITANEARLLYLALTKFSNEAERKVMELAVVKKVTPERACFMVHHGIWNLHEMEMILRGSQFPEHIIHGSTLPSLRLVYQNNLVMARGAILSSFLTRALARKERIESEGVVEMELDEHRLATEFIPEYFANRYSSTESINVPWLVNARITVQPDQELITLVRPRGRNDLRLNLTSDITMAAKMLRDGKVVTEPSYICILVPRDFDDLPPSERMNLLQLAEQNRVYILVCPESVLGLNKDAEARLERSKVIRK